MTCSIGFVVVFAIQTITTSGYYGIKTLLHYMHNNLKKTRPF